MSMYLRINQSKLNELTDFLHVGLLELSPVMSDGTTTYILTYLSNIKYTQCLNYRYHSLHFFRNQMKFDEITSTLVSIEGCFMVFLGC